MTKTRQTIHIVRHQPTGAEIPVIIRKVSKDNVITDYYEYTEKRKGFTLAMLQNRWDKARDDVLELLKSYQVPSHVRHADLNFLSKLELPIDVAIFFEEYVYGIEKKAKLPHSKLKPKSIESLTEH